MHYYLVAVQGVNSYLADAQGFFAGGSVTGGQDMAALIAQRIMQCPSMKYVYQGI